MFLVEFWARDGVMVQPRPDYVTKMDGVCSTLLQLMEDDGVVTEPISYER